MPPVPSAPPYQQYPGQPYPTQQYPAQPYPGHQYPSQPYPGPAVAPAKSSNKTLIIVLVVVGALLVLCCAGVIGLFALRAYQVDAAAAREPGITFPTDAPGVPGGDETVATPTGANANLALGKAVMFSDDDGTWTVAVTARAWSEKNCGSAAGFFPDPDGTLLIVDVAFEVTKGTASINPFFFDYIDSSGKRGDYAILSGCDEPPLESDNDLPAGTRRTGKVVFDVTVGQTGVIQYENLFGDDSASWKITP
jgi:hypothetical protein